ncbi:MAG: tetratricopeptide repeat protein [Microgenomates group bacterium]|nr:tetratricopeptide repeat protein [Microgenomates group bacterium]
MSRIKKILIFFIIFLFPLFFLTITQEFYLINKFYFLAFGSLLLLLSLIPGLLSGETIVWQKKPLDMPIILFNLTTIISVIISSPNKVQALLNPNFGPVLIFSLTVMYFFLSRLTSDKPAVKTSPDHSRNILEASFIDNRSRLNLPSKSKIKEDIRAILNILFASSIIISLLTIVFFFNPLKNLSLSESFQFLKNSNFTPLGTPLNLVIYLGFFVVLTLNQLIQSAKKNQSPTTLEVLTFVLSFSALSCSLYNILKPNQNPFLLGIALPPYRLSWYAAVETFKNPLTGLFGVGVDNFSNIFTKVKDIAYNQSPYWQVRMMSLSHSSLLQILTEAGLFGLLAFILILVSFTNLIFYTGDAEKKLAENQTRFWLPIGIYLLLIFLFFPPGPVVFFLLFVFLALISLEYPTKENEMVAIDTSDNILSYATSIFIFIFASLSGYLLGRSYWAEFVYKKSLNAWKTNNLGELYNDQKEAIRLNPFLEKLHIDFSQTNLILANNVISKYTKPQKESTTSAQITDQEKQIIAQAIQASIAEAKAALSLNSGRAIYWENLANIYKSIIGLIQGAETWSISSYQRAIVADPINPTYFLGLGGLYYSLRQYDDAIRMFEQTVNLKPDWANAYYNLAWASYNKGDYVRAVNEMQNAIKLVDPKLAKDDYEKAKKELEEFKKKLPKNAISPTPSPAQNKELILPTPFPTSSKLPITLPKEASPEAK